jgi:restriction system protein
MASMPWQAGIVTGLIGYLAIRHGLGWYLGATANPYLSGLGKAAASGIFSPLGWMLLLGCWIAALTSFLGRAKRRDRLDGVTGTQSLRGMNWREFEMLAGEAFRRQGYEVKENGLGGADGGIDLILRAGGKTILVQCKQWRNQRVDVKTVREMFGVLVHERADALKIVALGDYTPDARRFARGKPIELIDGTALLGMTRSVQRRDSRSAQMMDRPAAFIGSVALALSIIYALSGNPSATAASAAFQPTYLPPASARTPTPASPLPHVVRIQPAQQEGYGSVPQTEEELREWKRRNAEGMKILEKTTPEMEYR